MDHGAVQKRRGWVVAPLRMRSVQDYVIPKESTPYTAGGLYFWWLDGGSAIQVLGDEMIWVPKLYGALVWDSGQRAAAWRRKIRGQDGLPDDEDAEFRA